MGFEPAVPEIKQLQTYALGCKSTVTGTIVSPRTQDKSIMGFEPAVPEIKQLQTYALGCKSTVIGTIVSPRTQDTTNHGIRTGSP